MRLMMKCLLTCCLFLWGGSMQAIDHCLLKVSADPEEGAYVTGSANYRVNGGQLFISTSARNTEDYTYTFLYWTLNGVRTSYSQNFYYTPTKGENELVAHYEKTEVPYDPESPLDPSSTNIKREYYLYLTANMEGVCSFSMDSGNKVEEDKTITLSVYYLPAFYNFEGWKLNGEVISTEPNVSFTMPGSTTTLEACFSETSLDHESLIVPVIDEQDVDIAGDADNNGEVDKDDVVAVSKYIMGKTVKGFNKEHADINKDGKIDVVDIVLIIKTITSTRN